MIRFTAEDSEQLARLASAYLQSHVSAHSGYFPNDTYGRLGQEFQTWAQRFYDAIMAANANAEGEDT